MAKVEIRKLVATAAIADRMKVDYTFNHFINSSLDRFKEGDWGEVTAVDKDQFNANLAVGQGILQGVYTEPNSKAVIWIFTEWDHNTTTILFPYEW